MKKKANQSFYDILVADWAYLQTVKGPQLVNPAYQMQVYAMLYKASLQVISLTARLDHLRHINNSEILVIDKKDKEIARLKACLTKYQGKKKRGRRA